MAEKQSWFKTLAEKYNALCKDLGVDAGACRGCVPVVKFDPEKNDIEKSDVEKTSPRKPNREKAPNHPEPRNAHTQAVDYCLFFTSLFQAQFGTSN